MSFDFATVMVSAVFVTGLIWGVDSLLWKPKRAAGLAKLKAEGAGADVIDNSYREPILVEYARSFFPVILVVLILRSFLVEPFRIPSGSMMPTLLSGDFILVNKFTYGIRLPAVNTKVISLGEPARGDVVVFRYPNDPAVDYIKRVVGLPGDTITYYGRQVYVNGQVARQQLVGTYSASGAGFLAGAELRKELLSDGEHDILVMNGKPTIEGEFRVPAGHYFVMGDNRDNSNDSRYWGFVPEENLVGRAFMIWMNWDNVDNRISWERIGNMIR